MILLTVCLALALPGVAAAELNLWISRHYAGISTFDAGQYREALGVLENGLKETKAKHRRAATLDQIGQVHAALGDFDQADSVYASALREKESALGRKHRDVAETLNNIADLHYLQDKKDGCEALYRRALAINERDQLNIQVCRSLNGLALLENDKGEYVEAEKLLQRAIKVHEKAERRDQPFLATVLMNLGILYTNLGRYAEAEPLLERAAFIHKQALRNDHPDAAVRMHATAVLYQATGRAAEGAQIAAAAEEIRAKQASAHNLY